jgi:uncharacterized protein (TIGR02186 family)
MVAFALNLTPLKVAQGEELVTDLSDHLVAIKSNFTGTDILLFGAVEADSAAIRALPRDIVVVVRGPNEQLVVRRKERRVGIWMNFQERIYTKVPSYYAVVSTRALALIADDAVLLRHQIGLDNLKLNTTRADKSKTGVDFRNSLIRLKAKDGLYHEVSDGVIFLGDTLFRAKIALPANVQVGYYTAEVFLFRNGKVIHAQSSPLYINKSGFERFIFNLAHRQSLLYGILAVVFALFAGWLASVLLRRR